MTNELEKSTSKITRNRWHKSSTKLPEKLIARLQELYPEDTMEYNKAVILCSRIFYDYLKEDILFSEPKDIPSNYIKKVIHNSYYKVWTKLRAYHVFIQKTNHGSNLHRSRSFVFNTDLINNNLIRIAYKNTKRKLTPFCSKVESIFEHISLDMPLTPELIIDSINTRIRQSINKRIDRDKKTYANRKGKVTKIEIDIDEFLEQRVEYVKATELDSITRILERRWRVTRNKTNNRLDSNFTNLNSYYHKYFRINNKAVLSFDLSNSQFTIFANLLQSILLDNRALLDLVNLPELTTFYEVCKMWCMNEYGEIKEDVIAFCSIATKGTLYEELESMLKLENRAEAKNAAFKLFFGKVMVPSQDGLTKLTDNDLMKKVRTSFPNVVGCIEAFKIKMTKSHGFQEGYKIFSIMLQKIEALIFIDHILRDLINKKYKLISCHDSFMFNDRNIEVLLLTELQRLLPYGFTYTFDFPTNKDKTKITVLPNKLKAA